MAKHSQLIRLLGFTSYILTLIFLLIDLSYATTETQRQIVQSKLMTQGVIAGLMILFEMEYYASEK